MEKLFMESLYSAIFSEKKETRVVAYQTVYDLSARMFQKTRLSILNDSKPYEFLSVCRNVASKTTDRRGIKTISDVVYTAWILYGYDAVSTLYLDMDKNPFEFVRSFFSLTIPDSYESAPKRYLGILYETLPYEIYLEKEREMLLKLRIFHMLRDKIFRLLVLGEHPAPKPSREIIFKLDTFLAAAMKCGSLFSPENADSDRFADAFRFVVPIRENAISSQGMKRLSLLAAEILSNASNLKTVEERIGEFLQALKTSDIETEKYRKLETAIKVGGFLKT